MLFASVAILGTHFCTILGAGLFSDLGRLWLGFFLLLLLPKANSPTKGVDYQPKPQPKAAFA
jgi:hypothetical protein